MLSLNAFHVCLLKVINRTVNRVSAWCEVRLIEDSFYRLWHYNKVLTCLWMLYRRLLIKSIHDVSQKQLRTGKKRRLKPIFKYSVRAQTPEWRFIGTDEIHVQICSKKTTCIQRPPAYKDHILQVPKGVLFVLLNIRIEITLYWSLGCFLYTGFTVLVCASLPDRHTDRYTRQLKRSKVAFSHVCLLFYRVFFIFFIFSNYSNHYYCSRNVPFVKLVIFWPTHGLNAIILHMSI